MRDLLKQALHELREYRLFLEEDTLQDTRPTHLEQAIEAALSNSEWVPVADRLPVVPEGEFALTCWAADKHRQVFRVNVFASYSKETIAHDFRGYTHWMYRQDDTPAPPRSGS